jgi:dihydrolipoamide dehydrogenase
VALIEKGKLGGVCLNLGCIPTKTLLHTAKVFAAIKESAQLGIKVGPPELDFPKMMGRKEQVVKGLGAGVQWLMKSNGIDVIPGEAKLISNQSVRVNGDEITGKNIIIAVGSTPLQLPVPGAEEAIVITSDEIFGLECLPDSMVIVGGGVIGVEMAFLFHLLGCPVTVIEMMDRIVPMMDQEISRTLAGILERRGVKIITGARVETIHKTGLTYTWNETTRNLEAAVILMAAGRRPNGDSLALDQLGIEHDRGRISADDHLRTNIPNVYAIGDVNGRHMLAHVASMEGVVAVENIMGQERVMDYSTVPQCIYTFPEVAAVGVTEEQAIQQGLQIKVSRFPVKANGKSMAEGNRDGLIKMIADHEGRILGVHILAPHATEMITQCGMAMGLGATTEALSRIMFPHPTVSEIISEAVRGISEKGEV